MVQKSVSELMKSSGISFKSTDLNFLQFKIWFQKWIATTRRIDLEDYQEPATVVQLWMVIGLMWSTGNEKVEKTEKFKKLLQSRKR